MFDISTIKVLHLEPTTKCNAVCPQCQRTLYSETLPIAELSINDVKSMFSREFVKQLDKMFMCGNYGDPAVAKDTIDIFKWFRSINPDITLGIDTNGGAQTPQWWSELAAVLCNPKDYVIFGIDGLEDTNHMYRVGVAWDKLVANITAFTSNGGNAHWDMLVYSYNEHQVTLAADKAKELGMKWFRTKVTKKKMNIPFLKYPANHIVPIIPKEINIDCHAVNEKSVYVDAHGRLFPCCFIGSVTVDPTFEEKHAVILNELSIKHQTMQQVLSKYKHIVELWATTPVEICRLTCNKSSIGTTHSTQWKNEIKIG